ncbi:3-oxoacyl-[acyl-carrier protein] reductase [Nonomuraea thailandensis]|uniref:3-oxoacyl-[acyl-carrier protein] reductase n=1 Tax=Nonomuraea thailandensis TaxID=1188745 RepID=A0A9X2JYT0_9ACTN|nr:SDR family oxidoreductase [Nonomuraea thailandensis]MCP2353454.1 3-oxoacyl-[acyl-carrier protein] reductase [Nonomuraea thailandensis]
MSTLDGKVALVTGSGRGIGRAIALKLAAHGARLVVNGLDPERAEETARLVKSAGGEAVAVIGDVTDDTFAERFVRAAVDSYGGADIMVNNAGHTWDGVIQKMTDEQWDMILDVHLRAPFRLLRALQPVISTQAKEERARGVRVHRKIVNVSSITAAGGNAGQVNYAAAKAGLGGLTKTLAKEWARYNVNVNAVAFGYIHTRLTTAAADAGSTIKVGGREIRVGVNPDFMARLEQLIPLGRMGTPQEAAGAVYLLCTPDSDYITGEILVCGGGYV